MYLPLPAHSSLNRLTFLLRVHAQALAADGQYHLSLENCIGMRRFAGHIGDDTLVMWVLSEKMGASAVTAAVYTLGLMPPDEATLTWLKEQLTSVPGAPWRPEKALKSHADMEVQSWIWHPGEHEGWREMLLEEVEDDAVRHDMEKLSESELFARAQASLDVFLRRVIGMLRRDMPYKDTQAEIQRLIDHEKEKAEKGDPIGCLMNTVEFAGKYYQMHINAMAQSNALLNAIEVYLVKARTGHLPKELPAGPPPDPYSGESFKYEITEKGFTLHCRAMSVDFSEIRKFGFKVRSQAQ